MKPSETNGAARLHYDAALSRLAGRRIAIIGFASQCHAHA